jgi:hypothetical protein
MGGQRYDLRGTKEQYVIGVVYFKSVVIDGPHKRAELE